MPSSIDNTVRSLLNYEYLDKNHLKGFDNYKYSSIDTNPIGTYVMHPFWNWLVEYFPRWVAPNLITFIGFMFTIAAFLLMSIYDYNYYASSLLNSKYKPVPNWVFIVVAIFIFIAYTLDGIDGKQARRTGSSGPVGELFDHGLDSWTSAFLPALLYSIFGREDYSVSPFRMYLICWNVFISFFASHWEKYNTGVLYLPWSYDISMLGTTVAFLVTGLFGYKSWKITLFGKMTFGLMIELVFYISSFASNLPMVIYNIYLSYKTGSGKNRTLVEALRPLFPLGLFAMLSYLWIVKSPNDILELDTRMVILVTGTIFSNISCKLIVAQMSNTRCDAFNWLLLPLAANIFLTQFFNVEPRVEQFLLHTLLTIVLAVHVHYGSSVVCQMCKHFNIDVFKIKHKST